MAADFFSGFRREQHFCLGVQLRPLTIGHALLLARINSPFVIGGVVSPNSLAQAVLVCSHKDSTTAESAMESRWCGIRMWLWGMASSKFNLEEEGDRFSDYLESQWKAPQTKRDPFKDTGNAGESPWIIRLLTIMLTEFHMTLADAMRLPVAMATALWMTRAEMDGRLKLWGAEDQDFMDAVAKMEEEDAALARN